MGVGVREIGFTVLGDAMVQRLVSAEVIVGFRKDGLFARILCLLNTIRLGDVLGKPAQYMWEELDASSPAPHGYDDGWRSILRDDRIVDVPPRRGGPWPANSNLSVSLPALLPGESLHEVSVELGRIARGLQLSNGRVLGESLVPGKYTCGLHARQGDSAQIRYMITKYFPASGWLQLIDRVLADDPTAVVFLASDEPRLLAEALQRRDARVRVASDVIPSGAGKLAADFAEALELAQACRLIAPRQSTFSMFASLVSGAPIETPEAVLNIEAIVEELVSVALRSYENDLGAALLYLDELGCDTAPLAGQRRALLAAGALLRGRPGGAGYKNEKSAPRHPATVGLGEPGVAGQTAPSQDDILAVLRHLAPRVSTRGKVRLGADHDGGYVVPDDLEGIAGAISIGVGENASFDLDLAERGIPVLLVDDTGPGLQPNHPLLTHVRRAWTAPTGEASVGLHDLVARADELTGRPGADLVLKVAAAGSEWEDLPVAQPRLLRRFRILAIELHGLTALGQASQFKRLEQQLSALTLDHQVIHLHASNDGRVGWVNGVPLASNVEVSLLRRDRATFRNEPVQIPGPLDRPNVPGRPDLVWTPFLAVNESDLSAPYPSSGAQGTRCWWFGRRR